jgi:hypothetical protein
VRTRYCDTVWQEKLRDRAASATSSNLLDLSHLHHSLLALDLSLSKAFSTRLHHAVPAHRRASMTVVTTQSVCVNDISVEEQNALIEIRANHDAHKAADSTKAYSKPQKKWHSWCLARAVKNGGKRLESWFEEYAVRERSVEETRRYVSIYEPSIFIGCSAREACCRHDVGSKLMGRSCPCSSNRR